MKNILVIGATGRTGKLLITLLTEKENHVSAFVRDKKKCTEFKNVDIIEGDVLNKEKLAESMKGQDIVVAILSGDVLTFAKNLSFALKKNKVNQIFWVTGMGIHHEVPGEVRKMLDGLCKKMPQYVQAADTIAESGTPYTLIRAAHMMDGNNSKYYIQHEGEELHSNYVDRLAVAHLIYDLIKNNKGKNESLGVTN